MSIYKLEILVNNEGNCPMINIDNNDFGYALIANMYKKSISNNGHGHGIQINKNINEKVALKMCDQISDVILKHTKKLFVEKEYDRK